MPIRCIDFSLSWLWDFATQPPALRICMLGVHFFLWQQVRSEGENAKEHCPAVFLCIDYYQFSLPSHGDTKLV
jgi:hypothetical protein